MLEAASTGAHGRQRERLGHRLGSRHKGAGRFSGRERPNQSLQGRPTGSSSGRLARSAERGYVNWDRDRGARASRRRGSPSTWWTSFCCRADGNPVVDAYVRFDEAHGRHSRSNPAAAVSSIGRRHSRTPAPREQESCQPAADAIRWSTVGGSNVCSFRVVDLHMRRVDDSRAERFKVGAGGEALQLTAVGAGQRCWQEIAGEPSRRGHWRGDGRT